jgi:hypothetical protein
LTAAEDAKRAGHYDVWLDGVKLGIEHDHLERNPPTETETLEFREGLKTHGISHTDSPSLTSNDALAQSSADLEHTQRMRAGRLAAEKIGPDAVEAQLQGFAFGMEHSERSASAGHADKFTAETIQNLHFSGAAAEAQRAGHYDLWREGVHLGIQHDHVEHNQPTEAQTRAFKTWQSSDPVSRSSTVSHYEGLAEAAVDDAHTNHMRGARLAAEKIGPDAIEAQLQGFSFGMAHAERSATFEHVDQLTAEAVQNLHFAGAADWHERAGVHDIWLDGVKLGIERDHLDRNPPSKEEAAAFRRDMSDVAQQRARAQGESFPVSHWNEVVSASHAELDYYKRRDAAGHRAVDAWEDTGFSALENGRAFGAAHAVRNAEMGLTKESVKELAEHSVGLVAKDAVKVLAGGPVGDALAMKDMAELASKAPTVSSLLASDAGYSAVSALAATAAIGTAKHVADELGITAKLDPVISAAKHHLGPLEKPVDSFHAGVQDFIHKGDAAIASVQQYAHEKLDPVIKPIEKVASEAASHVAKAAEPLTKPVEERMAAVGTAVSSAVGKGWDSAMSATERHEAQAVQQAYGSLLKATEHGSPGLTNDEARMVRAELPHVQKGDVFVVEPQGSMHLVPVGTQMPDFPKGSLHLDADALREAAGIQRAPQQHAPQQLAQAEAVRER